MVETRAKSSEKGGDGRDSLGGTFGGVAAANAVGSLEVVHLTSGQVAGQPLWQPQLSFAVRIDLIDLSSSQTLFVILEDFIFIRK